MKAAEEMGAEDIGGLEIEGDDKTTDGWSGNADDLLQAGCPLGGVFKECVWHQQGRDGPLCRPA